MLLFICNYCGSERKNHNSWQNHERTCPSNPNRIYYNGMLGKKGSNQYTKARELGLSVPESKCKGRPGKKGYRHSTEFKQIQRENAIKRGLGGVRPSKRIVYNEKTLGSSYELEVVKSLNENRIKWDTCKKFSYFDPNGKKRTYTPDIYLPDYNIYLDPKNDYLINNINPSLGFSDIQKINLVQEQNKIKVVILNKNELDWYTIKTKIDAGVV